jgi:hypothetical protein
LYVSCNTCCTVVCKRFVKSCRSFEQKIQNFEVPEIFSLKYKIFEKLEASKQLNFDVFKVEWEKVKPKNNYNLFASNPYENSFINEKRIDDINIEMDI